MTEAVTRRTHVAAADKAVRETDFYRLDDPQESEGTPPLLVEVMLSEVEAAAAPAIDHLIEFGTVGLALSDQIALTTFMAFQVTRGREYRARVQASTASLGQLMHGSITESAAEAMLADAGEEVTAEAIAEIVEFSSAIRDGELVMSIPHASLLALAVDSAAALQAQLFYRHWTVYWSERSDLITSDEPVVILDGPDADRRFKGGVATCDIVTLPLSPRAILVLWHPDVDPHPFGLWPELMVDEVDGLNRELAANCNRYLVERPDRRMTLSIPLPPDQPASIQRAPVPMADEPGALLYQQSAPSRWFSTKHPPALPVGRWWWEEGSARDVFREREADRWLRHKLWAAPQRPRSPVTDCATSTAGAEADLARFGAGGPGS